MKFRVRGRGLEIEASRWFKNGDHPLDYESEQPGIAGGDITTFTGAERRENGWEGEIVRYYRHPNLRGDYFCPFCEKLMHVHGWLDFSPNGQIVCPGDWVITVPGAGGYRAVSQTTFGTLFVERGVGGKVSYPQDRSAWVVDSSAPGGVRWDCPGCGGDCFGTSMGEIQHCHGNSLGTESEQTAPCGYTEPRDDPRAPKGTPW